MRKYERTVGIGSSGVLSMKVLLNIDSLAVPVSQILCRSAISCDPTFIDKFDPFKAVVRAGFWDLL